MQGVANIGVRPTFEENLLKPVLEVHLFDFDEDIYGATVRVTFRHKIRDEQKFADVEALKTQIHKDIRVAKDWFGG